MIPSDSDPIILLSYVNTQLRDKYKSFEEFCDDNELVQDEIVSILESVKYYYNPQLNQFKHRA